MKLSVCGKGGSGKSTVVALLVKEAVKKGYQVVVVDSDESNSGLFRMLGFESSPLPLMDFIGGKNTLKRKMGQPNIFSRDKIAASDIPGEYILNKDGIKFVSIGKIMQSLEGCACPMGVLNREFLKKLALEENEIAIVDMEAGIEHFGRGVDTSIDSVLVVVEPSLESVNIGQKIYELSSGIDIDNVWAILNKVPSEEVAEKLKKELLQRGIKVAGCIYFNDEIFKLSMDGKIPQDGTAEIKEISNSIFSGADEK